MGIGWSVIDDIMDREEAMTDPTTFTVNLRLELSSEDYYGLMACAQRDSREMGHLLKVAIEKHLKTKTIQEAVHGYVKTRKV